VLPPDRHVHTEWSWDAPTGSMERTCARALDLGLRSVAFTDHAYRNSAEGDAVRGAGTRYRAAH